MNDDNSLKKFVVILLLFAVLGLRLNTVSHNFFVLPLQDFIAHSVVIGEPEPQPQICYFKFKSYSLEAPIPDGNFLLINRNISGLRVKFPISPQRKLPEGHMEIFIPPA